MKRIRNYIAIIILIWLNFVPLHAQETLPPAMKAQRNDYCVECHQTLSGKMGLAVSEWKKSVHAKREANCNICHGGNPDINDKKMAKEAKFGFAGKGEKYNSLHLCGRGGCHASAINLFKLGPHYAMLVKKGKPECIDCHGAHEVLVPKVKHINVGSCMQCHPAAMVESTIVSLQTLEQKLENVQKNVDYLISKNAEARDLLAKLADVKILYRQLVHIMSIRELHHTRKEIELQLNELIEKSQTRVMVVRRLDINYAVTILLGFLVIITFMIFTIRTFARSRE